MVGRSEDGSGSVKVTISQGDTKPLKRSHPQDPASDPLFLSSKLSPINIFVRGFVSPRLILTFTLQDPSSLLPTMLDPFSVLPSQTRRIHHHSHSPKHIESILTPTLPSISDPSSLPPSQARQIHPHSHPHKHAGSVRYCKSTVFYRTPAPIIVYYFPYITCLLYLLFLIKHVRTSG